MLVAFGSNLASSGLSPAEILQAARQEIVNLGLPEKGFSRIYRTPAFPPGSGPEYCNAAGVFEVAGRLTAAEALAALHRIEARFNRQRDQRWGARTLDLDLVAMGDLVLPDAATQDRWRGLAPDQQRVTAPDRLILPHPRMQDRAFVLVPLADVAPDWVHPRLGRSVRQMLEALPADLREEVTSL